VPARLDVETDAEEKGIAGFEVISAHDQPGAGIPLTEILRCYDA
jgi:hypothetical protein